MNNPPTPEPQDNAALMAQFNDLLLTFGNLAFDCGDYVRPSGATCDEGYDDLCRQKSWVEAELRRLFRLVLSK